MTRRTEQDTAAHFLLSQADRLLVTQVELPDGGWAMALLFDPGYREPSPMMVDYYRRRLGRILRHEQELRDGRVHQHPTQTGDSPEMRPGGDAGPGGGLGGQPRPGTDVT